MTTETNKLSAHTTWLFAFGSIATGIAASYALTGLGTKVTAAVYFAIVAIGMFGHLSGSLMCGGGTCRRTPERRREDQEYSRGVVAIGRSALA